MCALIHPHGCAPRRLLAFGLWSPAVSCGWCRSATGRGGWQGAPRRPRITPAMHRLDMAPSGAAGTLPHPDQGRSPRPDDPDGGRSYIAMYGVLQCAGTSGPGKAAQESDFAVVDVRSGPTDTRLALRKKNTSGLERGETHKCRQQLERVSGGALRATQAETSQAGEPGRLLSDGISDQEWICCAISMRMHELPI